MIFKTRFFNCKMLREFFFIRTTHNPRVALEACNYTITRSFSVDVSLLTSLSLNLFKSRQTGSILSAKLTEFAPKIISHNNKYYLLICIYFMIHFT